MSDIPPISPVTRRLIIYALGVIAIICIAAEIVLALYADDHSDALLAIASGCTGGIAGLAVPSVDGD